MIFVLTEALFTEKNATFKTARVNLILSLL